MKEVELNPIWEDPADYDKLEKAISDFFRREIYLPLLKEAGLTSHVLANARDDLRDAIAKGRIVFSRGKFTGRLSSKTSREIKSLGGRWSRQGYWTLPSSKLPMDIRDAIEASSSRFQTVLRKIDRKLQNIFPEEITERLKLEDLFNTSLWKIDRSLKKTTQNLTVQPTLSEQKRKDLARDYTTNMRLYIKDWTKEEIIKLRTKVQQRSFHGERYEGLADMIEKSYAVSRNKAKFLARQETSLLMAKFKEARYTEIGSVKYRWDCVSGTSKHPVRPMHKRLDGKIFEWKNPPVVNQQGDRKNPGEDYGCRCTARPILVFNGETQQRKKLS